MNYLLDTCVLSELVAKKPNARVLTWLEGVDEQQLFLTAVTIGEIQKGIAKLPESKRKQELEDWLSHALLGRFENRIISLDIPVMLTWGQLVGHLEAQGEKMPAIDSLIAATARHHQLILVTRNEADFMNSGIDLYNPW